MRAYPAPCFRPYIKSFVHFFGCLKAYCKLFLFIKDIFS
jgi:hypothetical protein